MIDTINIIRMHETFEALHAERPETDDQLGREIYVYEATAYPDDEPYQIVVIERWENGGIIGEQEVTGSPTDYTNTIEEWVA